MIRQTMEWNDTCTESQCARCSGDRSTEWREQVLALAAAVTFFFSGIAVILLGGGLIVAVAAGLVTGICAMLPASRLMNAVEKRRAPMCARL